MSDLPDGFVLEQPTAPALPDGFQMEAAPAPKSFGLGDTWPAKLAKGIGESLYSAVTLPGDVMAGKASVPGSPDAQAIPGAVPFGAPDSAGERVADLALIGNPASVARGSGKAIAEAAGLGKSKSAPSIEALDASATEGFQSPEVANLNIKSPAITNFADRTQIALNNAGLDEVLAPKTFGLLARLQKAPDGSVVSGANVQTIRRAFGNAASSPDATERLAAKTVIDHLDDLLPGLPKDAVISGDAAVAAKTLENARGDYAAARRSELIDDKVFRAELRAASANSGQNVANTLRQRMADVLLTKGESRGFAPEELAQIERVSRGSGTENAIRFAGNVLGGGGGLGAAITGLMSAGIAPAVGYGLKQLSNNLTMRQISKLSDMVRSNAPLASSMQKFGEKSRSFAAEKTPATRSDLILATRNLANNLKGTGIAIAGRDLAQNYSNQSE